MLAYGYGTPEVYAGFAFATGDDSPPADANGFVTDTTCGNGWECTDRITGVANLVGWHNVAGNAPVTNWYDDGVNLIVVQPRQPGLDRHQQRDHGPDPHLQHRAAAAAPTATSSTAPVSHGHCTGPTVTVDRHGLATVTVPAKDSVAIYPLPLRSCGPNGQLCGPKLRLSGGNAVRAAQCGVR